MVFSFSQERVAAHSRARVSSRVLRVAVTAATRAAYSQFTVAATAWAATASSSSFLLAAAAATVVCCSSTERLEVLFGMVGKMVVVGRGEP
jgi:hypothetical protein